MSEKKTRVVVLGAGPNGLGIVRALHRHGDIEVWVVDINGTNAGRFTRLARVLKWDYPETDIAELETRIRRLSAHGERVILFPTRDVEVNLLAELSTVLPDHFIYYRNSAETVYALADKNLVDQTARKAELHLPRTHFMTGPMSPQAIGFRFPILMKPLGQGASQTPFKNFYAQDEAAFQNVLQTYDDLYNNTIIQEFIPGGDDHVYECIVLIDQQRRTLGAVEFQKIRQYLPMRGMTSFGRTVLSQEMVPLCERLTQQAGYSGLIDVEFKKDADNGNWVFLEANLRLPIFNSVFPASGANMASLYVNSLLGKTQPKVFAERTATWMHEENDLSNVLTRKVDTPVKEWLRQFFMSETYAFWNKRDPLPGLYAFGRIFMLSLRKVLYLFGLLTVWSKLFRWR